MKYVMDTSKITPQECRDRAAGLLAEAEEYVVTGDRERVLVAKAQVWATLATVPEPLEEIEHTAVLDSTPVRFPIVTCPHGSMIGYEPQENGTLALQDGAYGCAGCC